MDIRRKLMAVILAAAMMVCYMPALAFAEGGAPEDNGSGDSPAAAEVQETGGDEAAGIGGEDKGELEEPSEDGTESAVLETDEADDPADIEEAGSSRSMGIKGTEDPEEPENGREMSVMDNDGGDDGEEGLRKPFVSLDEDEDIISSQMWDNSIPYFRLGSSLQKDPIVKASDDGQAVTLKKDRDYTLDYYYRPDNNPDDGGLFNVDEENDLVVDDAGDPVRPAESSKYIARLRFIGDYADTYAVTDVMIDIGAVHFVEDDSNQYLFIESDKPYTLELSGGLRPEDLTLRIGSGSFDWRKVRNPDYEEGGDEDEFIWEQIWDWDKIISTKKLTEYAGDECCTYSVKDGMYKLTVHGDKVYEALGGDEYIDKSYNMAISTGDNGEVFLQECYAAISKAEDEIWNKEDDCDMLLGWDRCIDDGVHRFIRNAAYPYGYDKYCEVTSVEITDGWEFLNAKETNISVETEQEDGVEVEKHYLLKDEEEKYYYRIADWDKDFDYEDAQVKFKVSFNGIGDEEEYYEFTVTIREELYEIDLYSDDGRYRGLPNSDPFDMTVSAVHKAYDENGEYYENDEDLTYRWSFAVGGEMDDASRYGDEPSEESWQMISSTYTGYSGRATVTESGGALTVSHPFADFTVKDNKGVLEFKRLTEYYGGDGEQQHCDEFYVKAEVVDDEGQPLASTWNRWDCSDNYYEIEPSQIDDLDVGEATEPTIFRTVRYYVNEEGKNISETVKNVTYSWNYNSEFASITYRNGEGEDTEIGEGTLKDEDGSGISFTITRLRDWEDEIEIVADWYDTSEDSDPEHHDISHRYWFNERNYEDLNYDDHDMHLYTDVYAYNQAHKDDPDFEPARTSNRLNVGDLFGAGWEDDYDLTVEAGHYEDYGDDEGGWTDKLVRCYDPADPKAQGEYIVEKDDESGNVYVSLRKSFVEGIAGTDEGWDDIRIDANLYRKGSEKNDENRISSCDAWFHISRPSEDYEGMEENEELLPWDNGSIHRWNTVYVRSSEFPRGEELEYEVTGVEITDGWEYLDEGTVTKGKDNRYYLNKDEDEGYDPGRDPEGKGPDAWWYYEIKSKKDIEKAKEETGDDDAAVSFKVSYKDYDYAEGDPEKEYDFTKSIVYDKSYVWIDTDDGCDNGAPGAAFELTAGAWREFIDDNGNRESTDEGFTFTFELGEGCEKYATLTQAGKGSRNATLRFKNVEAAEHLGEEIWVTVKAYRGGEEVAENEKWFWLTTEHIEMFTAFSYDGGENWTGWVTNRDLEIMPGDSAVARFELRQYEYGLDPEADGVESDHAGTYRVVTGSDYSWEYDDEALTIEPFGDDGDAFTFTRLSGDWTNLVLKTDYGDEDDPFDYWMHLERVSTELYEYNVEFVNSDDGWRLFGDFTDGHKALAAADEVAVEWAGNVLDPDRYTLVIEREILPEDDDPYWVEVTDGKLTYYSNDDSHYRVKAVANEGSLYEGETEWAEIDLYSTTSLDPFGPEVCFKDRETSPGGHPQRDYYWFRKGESADPVVSIDGKTLTKGTHYNVKYVDKYNEAKVYTSFPTVPGTYNCVIEAVEGGGYTGENGLLCVVVLMDNGDVGDLGYSAFSYDEEEDKATWTTFYEAGFDEKYRTHDEAYDTEEYDAYFYDVHAGTVLEPVVKRLSESGGTVLDSSCYETRYYECEYDEAARDWNIKDEDKWSVSFPTEPGAYICEARGKTPYYGMYYTDVIRVGDHKWGKASYEWNGTNTAVTASHKCSECNKEETETVGAGVSSQKKATCTAAGQVEYTSEAFTSKGFDVQTKTVDTAALGHSWGDPAYQWSADNTKVTATRICDRCNDTETETVDAASEVTREATEAAEGERTWTSEAFRNKAFSVQTKTEEIGKVVTPEQGKTNTDASLLTADKEVAAANESSDNVLDHASDLHAGSSASEIKEALNKLETALNDARKALEAAEAAYKAALAYYDSFTSQQRLSAASSGRKLMRSSMTVKADEEPTLADAEQKLAKAKYNRAAAANTLAKSEKAEAMIRSVQADQAIAAAESASGTDAEKAEAAAKAAEAAAAAAEAAKKAEQSALETKELAAYAAADANAEEDVKALAEDLSTKAADDAAKATAAREEAVEKQLSASEAATVADAKGAAEDAADKADAAEKAVKAADDAVKTMKKDSEDAADKAKKAAADASAGNVKAAEDAVKKAGDSKQKAEKLIADAKAAAKAAADAAGTAGDKIAVAVAVQEIDDLADASSKLSDARATIDKTENSLGETVTAKTEADAVFNAAQSDMDKAEKKKSDADALANAKTAAKSELDKTSLKKYKDPELTAVKTAIADGKKSIDAATTVAAVNSAKTAALNTIKKQATYNSKLPKVTNSKPAAGSKSLTAKWKKLSKKNQKKVKGIEIQVAQNKKFTKNVKTVRVKKGASSKKINKLAKKKTYYVRIRTYQKKKGVTTVGPWSKVKSVKTR